MNPSLSHLHLLGICGTGMTALATLLIEAGYRVTGSDEHVYPPMSVRLAELGVDVREGYRPEHLDVDPDLVVVGNVIRKDNPEVQEAMRRGIAYRSMPHVLNEFFLSSRTPVVVAGTHGKSTLSTLTAWILEDAGEQPGFFIGAVGKNLGTGARIGTGPWFIVEGDEYDTAFFDKGPKFLHYNPQALVLTSVEFDHADIYRDIDHLMSSFTKLVRLVPPDGVIIACTDYELVRSAVTEASCRVITYGKAHAADYTPADMATDERGTSCTLTTPHGRTRLHTPLCGEHNLLNAMAAYALLATSGIDHARIQRGLNSFQGLARRQDIVGEEKGVTIIDDFAHHPTAVRETIRAVRMRYPGRRLWALFEPRSNTSRRNIFMHEYRDALRAADRVIIARVHRAETIPDSERLDTAALADDIMRSGTEAHSIASGDHIVEFVLRGVQRGDVVLAMSNGSFDDVPRRIRAGIRRQRL